MKIGVKNFDDVYVLNVKGKLMGGPETSAMHDKVKELLAEDKKKIVIDLSKVKWMNSSGLGVLMGCFTSLKNAGGELKICGATDKVKSLFMITKLITLFESYKNVKEAVESFK
ncbi:MAG: STAS domain-containing protein [bacterium]